MLSQQTIDIIKSTVPVLEEHGTAITTVFYKNLLNENPELLNIFNHTNQKKGRQQNALAATVLAAAKYIDRLETILPSVKQIAQKHRSLTVKPEHYPIVGEYLLKAIKEVLGDAATNEIIQAWGEAYGVIADAFISIEKEMYEDASSQKGGWSGFKSFTVVDKVSESAIITSFYLKPADGSEVPNFLPGQYVTVRMKIEGEEYLLNRQYSLSAAPGKGYFRISVKRERPLNSPEGKVSNYLHQSVKIGDSIELTAPAGDFTLDTEKSSPIVFLSGGIGITPLMSMAQSIAGQRSDRAVTFVHAAHDASVQPFREELSQLAGKLEKGNLAFVYANATEEDRKMAHFAKEGYIDKELLGKLIEPDADYYICGPVPFMKAMVEFLKDLDIDTERIHYEFFGPAMSI